MRIFMNPVDETKMSKAQLRRYRAEIFVDPDHHTTRQEAPYSYDAFWLWKPRGHDWKKTAHIQYSDRMIEQRRELWSKITENKIINKTYPEYWTPEQAKFVVREFFGAQYDCVAMAQEAHRANGNHIWRFYIVDTTKADKAAATA